MREKTKQTIATFDRIPWFRNVGKNNVPKVKVLGSWAEAVEHCSSLHWENFTLEALNEYREILAARDPARWDSWNELTAEVEQVLIPLIKGFTHDVTRANKLPPVFEECVLWDLLGTCLEVEFSDVCPPIFFSGLAHYYARGHFPCGWAGSFPAGQLVVY